MSTRGKVYAVLGGAWLAALFVPLGVYAGLRVAWWYAGELWRS